MNGAMEELCARMISTHGEVMRVPRIDTLAGDTEDFLV